METTHDELIAKPIQPESPEPLPLRAPLRLVQTAVFLGILADWLFYGKPLGISLLLFVALVVGGLWWNGRTETISPTKQNLWLLLPLFFFASMAALRTNSTLTTLNVLAVLCLLAYLAFFYAAGRVANLNLVGYILLPLRVFGRSLALSAPVIRPTVQEMRKDGNGRTRLLRPQKTIPQPTTSGKRRPYSNGLLARQPQSHSSKATNTPGTLHESQHAAKSICRFAAPLPSKYTHTQCGTNH